jgi:hypothetical protein
MSIKTTINTPENTLNYMKYVEIENDTRYPAVTGGSGEDVFNKAAILVQQVDPFNTGIGSGTGNQQFIEKFGANLSVGGDLETIWEEGGIYNYLTTTSKVSAISDNIQDSLNGTGARTIEIEGLDGDYNVIKEVISCNATDGTQGGPESVNEFLRVYRAVIKTAGVTGTNDGFIDINTNTGPIIAIGTHGFGVNEEGFGQSQTSVYTIPADKTGYLTQWSVGTSDANKSVHAYFMSSEVNDGTILRIKDVMFLNNYSIKDYKVPLAFPAKTDLEVRAYDGATGAAVSTSYNIILVDN